jgi:hypothetical protein
MQGSTRHIKSVSSLVSLELVQVFPSPSLGYLLAVRGPHVCRWLVEILITAAVPASS